MHIAKSHFSLVHQKVAENAAAVTEYIQRRAFKSWLWCRAARWYICIPKSRFRDVFGVPWNIDYIASWSFLWPVMIFCGTLVKIIS
jgi:hypothetical protein